MCTRGAVYTPKPQEELAALMKQEMGVDIDPRLLKLFIRFKWADVARLAHAIHDGGPQKSSS